MQLTKSSTRFFQLGILIVIILIGAFLRLSTAYYGSFAFTYDVGRDMLALLQLMQHHISLIGPTTGLPGVFYGPWWYWILLIPFYVSGGDPRAIDAFMGITGVLTVLVGYMLGKRIAGSWFGLLLAAMLSLSPALIGISVQIWNPNLAPLITIVILYLLQLFSVEKRNNRRILILCILGFLAALTFDSIEIVYGSIQIVVICTVLSVFLRKQLSKLGVGSFALGVLLVELPRLAFELRHHFLMTQTLFHSFFSPSVNSVKISFLDQMKAVFSIIYQQFSNSFSPQSFLISLIFFICMLIAISIVLLKYKQENTFIIKICLVWIAVYFFILCFFKGEVWGHFVIGIPTVFILLFSYAVFFIARQSKQMYRMLLIICLLIFFVYCFTISFPRNKPHNDPAVFSNQLHVIDYIYSSANKNMFSYDVYTPPIIPYTYQYLFTWYGMKEYGYEPVNNAHILFNIIEPDASHPTLRRDWLSSHNKNATIVKEKIMLGNILIQTKQL